MVWLVAHTYLLTYLLTNLLTYLQLTYLITYLLNYLLTYLLISWSKVHLEKLTGSQLVKKFPALYGTQRFITAFTSARNLSLSWASSIQSIPPHHTSWKYISILSSHLSLGFPNGLFPLGFPTKPCTHLPFPPYVLHAPPTSFFSIWSPEQYLMSSTDHQAIQIIKQYRSLSSTDH